jgi:4-amino-4-deoxy-L-arabinose transferase-like glycosyltransferase
MFAGLVLTAYLWATPWRDLYGIEARNALMAREMLEGGWSFIPTAMGRPYLDYLPLYFGLEALFAWPWGRVTTWSAVLPSAISGAGMVLMTWRLGRAINSRVAWLAALILATLPGFWLAASRASIDMLLALGVCVAIFSLFQAETNRNSRYRFAWLLTSTTGTVAAFLAKGPVGLVLPAAIWGGYLIFERRWNGLLRFLFFSTIIGLVCIAGEFAMLFRHGGVELVREALFNQVTTRLSEKPNHSLLYYPASLLRNAVPWNLWAGAAWMLHCRSTNRARIIRLGWLRLPSHPVTRLALVWFAAVFCLFSLASVRHGRYLLPLFPALALLLAAAVDTVVGSDKFMHTKRWEHLLYSLLILLLLACYAAVFLFRIATPGLLPMLMIWSAAVVGGCLWVHKTARFSPTMRIAVLTALVSAAALSANNLLLEPLLSARESGRAFVATAESLAPPEIPITLYGNHYDKDWVKYALYSKRLPSTLRFPATAEELAQVSRPTLLVGFQQDLVELGDILQPDRAKFLTQGLIHARPVLAYLLPSPETSP